MKGWDGILYGVGAVSSVEMTCGWKGCQELYCILHGIFSPGWRALIFASHRSQVFDIGEVSDLVLLMALGSLNSAVERLYHLLGQATTGARFAHRLLCAWQRLNAQKFPEEHDAANLLRCVELLVSNQRRCKGGLELLSCPPAVLALLQMRLGCRIAEETCCSVVCWLGAGCGIVAEPPGEYVLCDSATRAGRAERVVMLGNGRNPGLSIFMMRCHRGGGQRPTVVSVADTVAARKAMPMQLSALRAALLRRSWRWLRIKWLCTLTPAQKLCKTSAEAVLPDCTAAAFRDESAAAEWAALAAELEMLYDHRSKSGVATAQKVGQLMGRMAPLLPLCHSRAVQRVLELPLVNLDLSVPGFAVYCLISLFIGKPYVGAVWSRSLPAAAGALKISEAVVLGKLTAQVRGSGPGFLQGAGEGWAGQSGDGLPGSL